MNPTVPRAWLSRLLALLLGASLVFAYAPFGHSWLTLPVLLALLLLLQWQPLQQAWQLGFSFGLGWFSAGLSWIFVSIDTFGGMPIYATIGVLALLFSYLSLFPATALWLWRRAQSWQAELGYWSLPLIWLLFEQLRGTLLTGFPWLQLGYTQTDSWLSSYAAWLGVEGITAVLWLLALLILKGWQQRRLLLAGFALILVCLPPVLDLLKPIERNGEHAKIALIQGNIAQELKWNPDQYWPNFTRYRNLSVPYLADHDIVIWPESAVTMPEPFTDNALSELHQEFAESQTALITGIIDIQANDYFNSMIVLGQDADAGVLEPYRHGHSNRYNKHQLLPIGEFVPFEDLLRPLAPLFDLPMSSFTRGALQQAPLRASGLQLTAAICYEIAFSELIRQNLRSASNFIVTVSNDTWFGASHGPAQHLQIARMRAIEFGRPVLRATNNGLTAVIDENGRELARAAQFEVATLSSKVPIVQGFTWYQMTGSWSIFVLLLAILGFIALSVVKRHENQ